MASLRAQAVRPGQRHDPAALCARGRSERAGGTVPDAPRSRRVPWSVLPVDESLKSVQVDRAVEGVALGSADVLVIRVIDGANLARRLQVEARAALGIVLVGLPGVLVA